MIEVQRLRDTRVLAYCMHMHSQLHNKIDLDTFVTKLPMYPVDRQTRVHMQGVSKYVGSFASADLTK